jgi:hypothetical protein
MKIKTSIKTSQIQTNIPSMILWNAARETGAGIPVKGLPASAWWDGFAAVKGLAERATSSIGIEVIRGSKRHGKPVTLNGYCQGGFNAMCNLFSGELDGLLDAFITCVAPMDGMRSRGPVRFQLDLNDAYCT